MVVGDQEKWGDSGNFGGRVIESADGLDVREKEKEESKMISRFFGLNNWVDGVTFIEL